MDFVFKTGGVVHGLVWNMEWECQILPDIYQQSLNSEYSATKT